MTTATKPVGTLRGRRERHVPRDAYGNQLASTSDSIPNGGLQYRFVGGLGVRWDATTGLYYMRARWNDPVLGRFMGRDPKGSKTNPYRYCRNNPVRNVDPSGKCYITLNYSYAAPSASFTIFGVKCMIGLGHNSQPNVHTFITAQNPDGSSSTFQANPSNSSNATGYLLATQIDLTADSSAVIRGGNLAAQPTVLIDDDQPCDNYIYLMQQNMQLTNDLRIPYGYDFPGGSYNSNSFTTTNINALGVPVPPIPTTPASMPMPGGPDPTPIAPDYGKPLPSLPNAPDDIPMG